jgi:IS1 family transposase
MGRVRDCQLALRLGGVLIWILGILFFLCSFGNNAQCVQILEDSFLRGVYPTTSIKAAKVVGLGSPQAVRESNLTVDCHESPLSKRFLRDGLCRDVEGVPLTPAFLLGSQSDASFDCKDFPFVGPHANFGHDLLNVEGIGRVIHGFKTKINSEGEVSFPSRWCLDVTAQRFNIHPLAHPGFLYFYRLERRLGRLSSFTGLPNNRPKGEEQPPRRNTFGPCYEFVPPLRFLFALLCLISAVAINGYGHGLIRFLCISCILCCGWLILGGHRYWCQDEDGKYRERSHTDKIVTQKLLTSAYYRNTVIGMANILSTDKQIAAIGALAEGSSIRSIERMTGVHRDTIMRLGVKVGQGCAALMDAKMRDLPCTRLEMDEIWGFVGKKERNVRLDEPAPVGNVWTFCAIDADTKLVPSFKVGDRSVATAKALVSEVASRMRNRVQISTDGLRAYVEAVENAFGAEVDYPQIVKTYGHEEVSDKRRYSAPDFVSSEKKVVIGHPDERLISTSYVERLNATTRLHMRRLTRLTLAFSKKRENFEAAVALHFAYYNFVKRHNTLRCTPAMAAGVERDFWSVGELLEAIA